MNIAPNDTVEVVRNIIRREGPYAEAGETGTVEEIFRPATGGALCAKVRMKQNMRVKTFRLTSLAKKNHA